MRPTGSCVYLFFRSDFGRFEDNILEVRRAQLLLTGWAGPMCLPPLIDALFAVLVTASRQDSDLNVFPTR